MNLFISRETLMMGWCVDHLRERQGLNLISEVGSMAFVV